MYVWSAKQVKQLPEPLSGVLSSNNVSNGLGHSRVEKHLPSTCMVTDSIPSNDVVVQSEVTTRGHQDWFYGTLTNLFCLGGGLLLTMLT